MALQFFVKRAINTTADHLLALFHLAEGGKVQQAIDKSVIDWCLLYVPFETGSLGKSAYTATVIGSGRVRYPGPYAHYLYYGEVYGPNIPVFEEDGDVPTRWWSPPGQQKTPTGRALEYATDVNPLAGAFWFQRMIADHERDILQEAMNNAKH